MFVHWDQTVSFLINLNKFLHKAQNAFMIHPLLRLRQALRVLFATDGGFEQLGQRAAVEITQDHRV